MRTVTKQNNKKQSIVINWEKIYQKIKANEGAFIKEAKKEDQKIALKKRAARLSKALIDNTECQEKIDLLAFQIESEHYGIEVSNISKVYILKNLTPLPGASPYVIGIINVKGNIVPVIDFRKIFELPKNTNVVNEKVIIVTVGDANFGLLADEVIGLESVLVNEIQRDLPTLNGIKIEYFKGVTNHQLVILDPLKIASHKSIVMNDKL